MPNARVTRPPEVILFFIAVITFFSAFSSSVSANGTSSAASCVALVGAGLGFLIIGIWIYRSISGTTAAATARIPDPYEIAASLQIGLGRPPTIEEIAAVHQMLLNQKHDAMLNLGIGLGAAYLIGHKGRL